MTPQDTDPDALVVRLQDYLRDSASKNYETVHFPPFTLFFHSHDSLIFFNYGIPDGRRSKGVLEALPSVRDAFASRQRRPRFEFIEEYSPGLAAALADSGFDQESRLQLMLCSQALFVPAPDVAGLDIVKLNGRSSVTDARDFLATRSSGFEGGTAADASAGEANRFLAGMTRSGTSHFIARMDRLAVGVASYSVPMRGITEVAGIATIEAFRGRGIGSALTSFAVREAYGSGVSAAFLSAADERVGRMYRRLGFRPSATSLAYIDGNASGR
jgi:ribosomal protein S18 acetylase RimI-like enzyme